MADTVFVSVYPALRRILVKDFCGGMKGIYNANVGKILALLMLREQNDLPEEIAQLGLEPGLCTLNPLNFQLT